MAIYIHYLLYSYFLSSIQAIHLVGALWTHVVFFLYYLHLGAKLDKAHVCIPKHRHYIYKAHLERLRHKVKVHKGH